MSIWGVPIPEELKVTVAQALKRRGKKREITQRVKDKLTRTIGEIKAQPADATEIGSDPSNIHKGLRKAEPAEQVALQAVYAYLKKLGLEYTLETLVQESTLANEGSEVDLDKVSFDEDEEVINEPVESEEPPPIEGEREEEEEGKEAEPS
jgi:hypothetical protein